MKRLEKKQLPSGIFALRKWIALFEAEYIGNCVDSFDEDGDCTLDRLGWQHVSDFAHAEEDAREMSHEEFIGVVPRAGHEGTYLDYGNGVYAVYNEDTDIHYFYA